MREFKIKRCSLKFASVRATHVTQLIAPVLALPSALAAARDRTFVSDAEQQLCGFQGVVATSAYLFIYICERSL